MMAAENVLLVVKLLERSHITVWIDGGWGVDATSLGRETRRYNVVQLCRWFGLSLPDSYR